jgi:FixJ family two-component response regulator
VPCERRAQGANGRVTHTNPKRIFVVEDDEDVRGSTRLFLEALGYEVLEFATAEALLAADCASLADCLVMDYQLPGMSGLDLLVALRACGCIAPAIFVSANGFHLQSRAAQLGVMAVLRKPLAADALSQWLEQIFPES